MTPHWQYQREAAPPLDAIVRIPNPSEWMPEWQTVFRYKPNIALRAHNQVLAPEQPGALGDPWYAPWREPVRAKLGLRAALQQAFAIDPFVQTQGEIILESEWHFAWSEPVRQKVGLTASAQLALTEDFVPITDPRTIPWYGPLSEPVRLKRGIRPELTQSFVTSWDFPSFSTFAWFAELATPPKPKSGQHVWLQRDFTVDPAVLTQTEFIRFWLNPLSEPVRLRPGLGAWQQMFYTGPTRAQLIPATITVSMAATEVNEDVAHISVRTAGAAAGAQVSIEEIQANRFGAGSIGETDE